MELKRDKESEWTTCFEYPRSIDYAVHTYISAGSSGKDTQKNRRAVAINSIKFYDNEVEIEGEAESIDMASYRDFKGSAQDLLHMGNVDGVLLKDEKAGRDAYNDKLLKYNSRYAQLVGKQKANTEGIEEIFNSLPHVDLIDMIRKDIHELDEKQRSFL